METQEAWGGSSTPIEGRQMETHLLCDVQPPPRGGWWRDPWRTFVGGTKVGLHLHCPLFEVKICIEGWWRRRPTPCVPLVRERERGGTHLSPQLKEWQPPLVEVSLHQIFCFVLFLSCFGNSSYFCFSKTLFNLSNEFSSMDPTNNFTKQDMGFQLILNDYEPRLVWSFY